MNLENMEKTWGQIGDKDPQYDLTIGPLRDQIGDEDRKTFWLKTSEIEGRTMRQLYIHKSNGTTGEPDEAVELIWVQ